MPPGKGFYGPKYKEKRSGEFRLAPMALLAGVPVLALFAWIGMCTLGSGDDANPAEDAPAEGQTTNEQVRPTELPQVAPTRDPAKKAAGANEGSGSPRVAEKPPINEYLIAGGKRFDLPLSVHAGVEDYFGAARADGKTHTGVDFSLTGLKNVPVESACDGFVTEASTDDVLGLHVVVDCGANFEIVLGWLASLRVTNGNNVSKATVVGLGESDGFLHVELRYKQVPIDPKDFMQIPGKEIIPWTPTPSPTPRPGDTPTPEPTATLTATPRPGETPQPGGGGSTQPPTSTPTMGPPTNTPTITPTPTVTPTPTRTPTKTPTQAPRPKTPTPLPRSD